MKSKIRLAGLVLSAALWAGSAAAKDVTQRILRETDYGHQVAEACQVYCQGNQRAGRLTSVDVTRMGTHILAVRASATLLNRHWQTTPKSLMPKGSDGVELFNFEMVVDMYGRLDERSCVLTVERIEVEDDRLKLSRFARDLTGKDYRIENCKRLVRGI